MLTVKIPDRESFILPQNCIYCYEERPNTNALLNSLTFSSINKPSIKFPANYYQCSRCSKLFMKNYLFCGLIPVAFLFLSIILFGMLAEKEIIVFKNIFLGIVVLFVCTSIITFLIQILCEKIANNYLLSHRFPWGLYPFKKAPVKRNKKLEENGFIVLEFTNDDYGRDFAELNHGQILSHR